MSIDFESNSRRVLRVLESGLEEALEDIGDDLMDQALDQMDRLIYDTPLGEGDERTGDLRASLDYDRDGLELEVYADTDYAVFVHEGTRKESPKPFLTNALKRVESSIDNTVALGLRKEGFR
jgi:HK97 gp10 family phage protein